MNIVLHPEQARIIKSYAHPWIFRSAIRVAPGNPDNGAIVGVEDGEGKLIGTGFYSAVSKIACRIFHWGPGAPPADWPARRLAEALALRRSLKLESNAYRLINAEGDYFPGLIADVYGKVVVLRPQIRGVERLVPDLAAALDRLLPGCAIYLKRDEKASRVEKLELPAGFLAGSGDDTALAIEEGGLSYLVDIREGQKTGFYLDQRDNRKLVGTLAEGRRVLNLFSYTGAFALAALRGGARSVDSVDTSQKALELAEKNYALNHFPASATARWIKEDGFDFLDRADSYDFIICDPPPFARTKGEVPGALRGYRRLQAQSLRRLTPGGLFATFSCSGAVDVGTFERVLFEAAVETGRPVRILRSLHAAPDHPWSIRHREGEYLKGILAYVD